MTTYTLRIEAVRSFKAGSVLMRSVIEMYGMGLSNACRLLDGMAIDFRNRNWARAVWRTLREQGLDVLVQETKVTRIMEGEL